MYAVALARSWRNYSNVNLRSSARHFSTSRAVWSGHNKWSTIKHAKGKNDAVKNKERSNFSHEISLASKCQLLLAFDNIPLADAFLVYGPDPTTNPRLALAITAAKKSGVPKALIETAIARGQGVSATGAALENVTVEAMFPPVAVVVDCQTDSKLDLLKSLRVIIKKNGGNATPTDYLFEKKGRIVLRAKEGTKLDEVLEAALDAGALDVDEEANGDMTVLTEPAETVEMAKKLSGSLNLEIAATDIIWNPNHDTKAPVDNEENAMNLIHFLEQLQEISGFETIYTNATRGNLSENLWAELESKFLEANKAT